MPLDAKLREILDAAIALGHPPAHELTPEVARLHRTEMMARFVPMPEYSAVGVEDRTIVSFEREIGVRVYTPRGEGPWPVVVFFHGGGGRDAGDARSLLPGAGYRGEGGGDFGGLPAGTGA